MCFVTILAFLAPVASFGNSGQHDLPGLEENDERVLTKNELVLTSSRSAPGSFDDVSGASLKIIGRGGYPVFSVEPLASDDETQIVLRVGSRATRTGDSKTLGYFSESYSLNDGTDITEHQAVYGVNRYTQGNYRGTVMGLHGLCMSEPGRGNTVGTCVGVQGFSWHADLDTGTSSVLIGVSGSAGTPGNTNVQGRIGTVVGVRGASGNRSSATVTQAISLRGIACSNEAQGGIDDCFTAQLAQPNAASRHNYALLVTDGNRTGASLNIGFRDKARTIRSLQYHQHARNLELHGMGLRPESCPSVTARTTIEADGCNAVTVEGGDDPVETIRTCDTRNQGREIHLMCVRGSTAFKDAVGNLQLSGDFQCGAGDVLTLICNGHASEWLEVSRSDN